MDDQPKQTEPVKDDDNWPNSFRTREELDAMLEAGFSSGISERTIEDVLAEAKKRYGIS